MEFETFSKIPRFYRDVIITEKLDGTNGQIVIAKYLNEYLADVGRGILAGAVYYDKGADYETAVWAGSRNRWLNPKGTPGGGDNHGFAKWVFDNAPELIKGLGPGRHYGEWYGSGIGRNYGLDHKRFALFNTTRWNPDMWTDYVAYPWAEENDSLVHRGKKHPRPMPVFVSPPECCWVVPVLYSGSNDTRNIAFALDHLVTHGSQAVLGYDKPEGIVIFHTQSNHLFKVTYDYDKGKWSL